MRWFFLIFLFCNAAVAQGINPITPAPNDLIQIIKPAFANPSNFYATASGLGPQVSASLICDGATDNTAILQAAENAAVALGGGAVHITASTGTSTCQTGTITKQSHVHWYCPGAEGLVLQLKNGVNDALVKGANFATLTGTNSAAGIGDFTIQGCSFDGNVANNSAYLLKAVIRIPGTGYTAGTYPITVSGSYACTTIPTVTFTVSGGVPNAITGTTKGLCAKPPTGPVAVTGGGGSNLELTLAWSAVIQIYGYQYKLDWDMVRNGAGDGIYSEWSTTAGCPLLPSGGAAPNCMEAFVSNSEIHTNGGNGIFWAGPHDSMISSTVSYQNGGDDFVQDAGQIQLNSLHGFGAKAGWELNGLGPFLAVNSVFEGGHVGNVYVGYQKSSLVGGSLYNCNGDGVRIGQVGVNPGYTTIVGTTLPDGCQIDFLNDAGGDNISVLTTAGTPFTGTIPYGSSLICNQILCNIAASIQVTNGASFPAGITINSSSLACLYNGSLSSCRINFDASGNITVPGTNFNINAAVGGTATKYVCMDSSGNIFGQVAAC